MGSSAMSLLLQLVFGDNLLSVNAFFSRLFPEFDLNSVPDFHSLNQLLIAVPSRLPLFKMAPSSLSMRHLLQNFIQTELCKPGSSFKSSTNVLLYGYRLNIGQIENIYPNSLHNYFMTETWNCLLATFGEPVISFIIADCCVFKKSANTSSWLQIAGHALSDKPIHPAPTFECGSRYKSLNRLSVMYGHPIRPSKPHICGLPVSHILLSLSIEDLCNRVFTCKTSSWQRKRLLSLLSEMRIRHSKVPYTALRNYYANPESNQHIHYHRVIAFCRAVIRRLLPQSVVACQSFLSHINKSKYFGMFLF